MNHIVLRLLTPSRGWPCEAGTRFSSPLGTQKSHSLTGMAFFVATRRFCCPNSRISQGRGSVRGEPLTGSPARVQSPARRRPILHSKIAAPKKKRHTNVCLFFFVTTHRFCCLHFRMPQGKECVQEKTSSLFPCTFNCPPTGNRFCYTKLCQQKASNQMFLFSAMWLQFDIFSLCNALPIYKFTEKINRRRPQEILSIHISIRLYEYNFDSFSNHIAFDK